MKNFLPMTGLPTKNDSAPLRLSPVVERAPFWSSVPRTIMPFAAIACLSWETVWSKYTLDTTCTNIGDLPLVRCDALCAAAIPAAPPTMTMAETMAARELENRFILAHAPSHELRDPSRPRRRGLDRPNGTSLLSVRCANAFPRGHDVHASQRRASPGSPP